MLSDDELERHLSALGTPTAGRALVRKIRKEGPVRKLQGRMDGVRTRFISRKMNRMALYAESRTCELPGLFIREYDPHTLELWPQPCSIDLVLTGPTGKTRLQHVPDLFLVTKDELIIEEWRDEDRLHALAQKRPHHFYKDESGIWHFIPIEQHLAPLGITYRLRSANEHPRTFLSNLEFLEDYTLESCAPVPPSEVVRLKALLKEHKRLPHHVLIEQHGFQADHVFQTVLAKDVFVDLHSTPLRQTTDLVIYEDELIARADSWLASDGDSERAAVSSAIQLSPGSSFSYDGKGYEVLIVGQTEVIVSSEEGRTTSLPIDLVRSLFESDRLVAKRNAPALPVPDGQEQESILRARGLDRTVAKLSALLSNDTKSFGKRTLQRAKKKVAGITSAQQRLVALLPQHTSETGPRLPAELLDLALEVIKSKHNSLERPTVHATYMRFLDSCAEKGLVPMSRSTFYRLVKRNTSVLAREGRREAYQQAPIPLHFDYGHPVHGVLPHEVCYCDHTTMNIFLKGAAIENLGKPTITLMVDGSLSMARAFYLSYQPPGVHAVLMCLRDYVRRHGRLPRVLVLDNGKEFHSLALEQFCDTFGIKIRWRRRSRPRDSSIVERMLGATETELLAQLRGNSIGLKNPRLVSSTHLPEKHIEWTLPALHGALDHYLFDIHPDRVHPRFGVSPKAYEVQLNLYAGGRGHMLVKFDELFKFLTAPAPSPSTRKLDPIRGVYVDGIYHWTDQFRGLKAGSGIEVRLEPWNAEVIYVNVNDQWVVARARAASALRGRHRPELDIQIREERRRRVSEALKDRTSIEGVKRRVALWTPSNWDERLREQLVETYRVYERLGMTEVLTDSSNALALRLNSELPRGQQSELISLDDGGQMLYQSTVIDNTPPSAVPTPAQDGQCPEPANAPEGNEYDFF